jgi:hypothetical protein
MHFLYISILNYEINDWKNRSVIIIPYNRLFINIVHPFDFYSKLIIEHEDKCFAYISLASNLFLKKAKKSFLVNQDHVKKDLDICKFDGDEVLRLKYHVTSSMKDYRLPFSVLD